MRLSELLLPTLREDPTDAEVVSHKLMLRAGMIRKLAAGIYTLLPLGVRVMRKVERIIREEMDRAGAQEVVMPCVLPADLWKESGRWDQYGKELLRMKDRHDREYCFGPTHEEVITDLARREVRSYRQLPINLYQIQTKFRDEVRPRFGVMRAREFVMKDAYSFDADEAGAEQSYERMYQAYTSIFQRCGLRFRAVEAESGLIGGRFSHEFMVLADTGEDAIVSCDACAYAANMERAEVRRIARESREGMKKMERVQTPGQRSVAAVTAFLGVPAQRLVKTIVFETEKGTVAVLIRGDHEVNEAKLRRHLGTMQVAMAGDEVIAASTHAPVGFAGPVGLDLKIIADYAVEGIRNVVVGANEPDAHLINVNLGRDFHADEFADIRLAQEEDPCPRCLGSLQVSRGIEVGHIFKLGTKYTEALGATYLDSEGVERNLVMGCYGIGVGRTAAAAIEQNHDEDGIIFPMPIAPFHVQVVPVNNKDALVMEAAEDLYRDLLEKGAEVLLDDRDERPGVKFKDADMIGIPLRLTVGEKNLKKGKVEIRVRRSCEVTVVDLGEAPERIMAMIAAETERSIPSDEHPPR
jgi:prolyl-tRNA synthetase